jgi:urea carboxylase
MQVEHGITELVHGAIDIVEAQLRLQVPALQTGLGNDPASLMERLGQAKSVGHCIEVSGSECVCACVCARACAFFMRC